MPENEKDKLSAWEIIKSKTVLKTPLFVIKNYRCKKANGHLLDYYVHEGPDSVLCVCIIDEGYIVVERQYRLTMRSISMDYPAGFVNTNDRTIEQAALRELREETGYVAQSAKYLFSLSKDSAFIHGKLHVFLVEKSTPCPQNIDQSDLIKIELLKPAELLNAIETGEMSCAYCISTTLRLARMLNWNI
jgi:ADP-ribose pyrophosphatase